MNPLKHFNARTLDDAVLAANENSLIVAGGTDCLSLLKNSIFPIYPQELVNIKTLSELDYIVEEAAGLRIGALTRLADIVESAVVVAEYGVLAEAAESVASPQIRNMGTIAGNLCQDTRCWYYRCSPFTGKSYFCTRKGGRVCFAVAGDNRYHAILGGKGCFAVNPSDLAVALAALDARITVKGTTSERAVPIKEFYTVQGNILKPHELVTDIWIPRPSPQAKQRFLKFRLRKAIDFAIVSVASIITMEDDVCRDASIVLGAVAPVPLRAAEAEQAIKGKVVNEETAQRAAKASVAGATPLSGNAYKVEIAQALVKRAILF